MLHPADLDLSGIFSKVALTGEGWDPALIMVLMTISFAQRQGYGAIDAAQLRRYEFFTRLGLFGIEPGTAGGARTFLRRGIEILRDPDAVLWLTAEGEFQDTLTTWMQSSRSARPAVSLSLEKTISR